MPCSPVDLVDGTLPARTKPKGSRKAGKSYEPRFLCDVSRANFAEPDYILEGGDRVPPFTKLVNPQWLAMKKNTDFETRADDPNLRILHLDLSEHGIELDIVHDEVTLVDIDYAEYDHID